MLYSYPGLIPVKKIQIKYLKTKFKIGEINYEKTASY